MTMMSPRIHNLFIFVALLSLISLDVYASSGKETAPNANIGHILSVYDDDIQQCAPVQKLTLLKETLEEQQSPIMRTVFSWLFPFGPAWNSILGTFYISSVPNFILAFIPAEINANTLNTMTAFATGGLLSDVFLHLVPHSFMGEHTGNGVHIVIVEEKRNILIGLGIFTGFAAFFFMEKTLRVLGGDEDAPGHSHSHSHSHIEPEATKASGVDASSTTQNGFRNRKSDNASGSSEHPDPKSTNGPSKLSAYLNLFGDFVHNIMAASFYASPLIGATTTLACFAHEIPHEIADYSILIRSGFSKKQAMQSQFLTAVGAFVSQRSSIPASCLYTTCTLIDVMAHADLFWIWICRVKCGLIEPFDFDVISTFIGIAVHNATATDTASHAVDLAAGVRQDATGVLGTTLQLSDLVIPFVAGGFLYIGAVAVLPTLSRIQIARREQERKTGDARGK
ncbi:LOW QUALITY PROTEIN: hypothetical protein CVT25_012855 [Psilocybe cyanescens]|uniref:Uncharacterized protein n=1 Tax=Psilocybe cyanescens TaxID=93625 RepID=A0A409XLU4_PSICY|nr:LOW QUALITY PROTEIN: hypothetical protein CVT25_012855 [Psilocybe cyanescens]